MDISNVKPSFNTNRQILGHIYPLDTPLTAILDVSDMCNFKCFYCFRGGQSLGSDIYGKNIMMNWEIFSIAVEQLKEFPGQLKQISLSHHGEPLCNKLLPKMLLHIHESGLTGRTSIHTNASLLTPQLIDELVNAHLGRMVISLEGLTAAQYKKNCGASVNFEKFLANIDYLFENKGQMELSIKIIESALGDKSQDDFFALLGPIADRVFVEKEVPLWDSLDINEERYPNKYGDKYAFQHICPLIFNSIVVSSAGDIYPCTHLEPPLRGKNIQNITLMEYWNGFERKNFLIQMLQMGRENISSCKHCYIPQNSIYAEEDIVDGFQDEILARFCGKAEI